MPKSVEKERAEFKSLIIKNPNYFGTFPKIEVTPISPMKGNTKYEELRCIGFYPENDLLEAVFDVKLPFGFNGSLCTAGSYEYVRFFMDWDGDGDFKDASEDIGITSVNVHNIPDGEQRCLDKTKPLSYAVTVKVDSKKLLCTKPNLVKVRAILSWELPPPAGDPDFVPPWGNVVDRWIQIKPAELLLKDIVKAINLKELKLEPSMLKLDVPISAIEELKPVQLKEIYRDKDVPEHRINIFELHEMALKVEQDPSLSVQYKLDPKYGNLADKIDVVLKEKKNTKYEELQCVGLNYDTDTLVATLTVKKPFGYCGGLCKNGSYEYVAFWVLHWDQIEQTCVWKYLGRSRVNVHDIPSIPAEGLQYAVYHSIDSSSFRDKCTKPKVLRIRAILSWQVPPQSTDPNYEPVWGNQVEALVQIKPGEHVKPGEQKPYILRAGGMALESISGNPPYTVLSSSIGDGYANGISVGGGYTALESPFGGVIEISGTITNPPNNPPPAGKLKYKMQYKKSGADWRDITNNFEIWIWIDGVPSGVKNIQVADAEGYFRYQKDLTQPVIREVDGDILAQWHTPAPEGDGLYEIRMLLYDPLAPPIPGVPAKHVPSNIVKIMVDNKLPDADVSLDAGPCEKFKPGSKITGKFKATDKHIWTYRFSVLPSSMPSNPVTHVPTADTYPALSAPGVPSGTFELDTTDMTPCGYVIYLQVWDRTIRNNSRPGNRNHDDLGFCLLTET